MTFRLSASCRPEQAARRIVPRRPRLEWFAAQRLEYGRNRLVFAAFVFAIAFAGLGVRLIDVTLFNQGFGRRLAHATGALAPNQRAEIVDRNGIILATTLPTYSLHADASAVPNRDAAAARLARAIPGLSKGDVMKQLRTRRRFVWLQRHLTPRQYQAVNSLGIPGIYVRADQRRVYPHGRLAAHIVGFTDVDSRGLAGIERQFDRMLAREGRQLRLTIDVRLQHILREEVKTAIQRYRAKKGSAVLLDANTGEVMAMVSLPDFDPNHPTKAPTGTRFNMNTLGVYEMGSTFKVLNTAMVLDAGIARLGDRFDARQPIRIASHKIRDYHPRGRWLSVDEIFVYSSNIGSAKMALAVGGKRQRAFLARMGLLTPATIELPEIGLPLKPRRWRPINTMTIAFGHGVAVTPIQFGAAIAATVNGGALYAPTLIRRDRAHSPDAKRVLSENTSLQLRYLMRRNVLRGTGRRAAVPGYLVGGKTGSADKSTGNRNGLLSSFVGAFPMHRPRFVLLVMLDEPKGNKETSYKATGGLVAAPTFARIVQRVAPVLGVRPVDEAVHDRRWAPFKPGSGVHRVASFRVDGKGR
jgi:cell division protein FtsI (penicillin-binding protein 3)